MAVMMFTACGSSQSKTLTMGTNAAFPPYEFYDGDKIVGIDAEIAEELAKRLGGEIISADSMQVYKFMNIGTDKISPDKMDGVPHHLIYFLDPH